MMPLVVASAAVRGLSVVVQKMAFDTAGFTAGYTFFGIGASAGAALLLLHPRWRRQIFVQSRTISSQGRF